jgi:CRP-like cAMP-binding protein
MGVNCRNCEVGAASGVGGGQFCPFVDRSRRAGELIYVEGEPAEHVWFVKSGTVVLQRESYGHETEGHVRAVRFAGTFIGLEGLVNDVYVDTARASTAVVLCGATRRGMDAWLGPKGSPARTALEITLRANCADQVRRSATDGNATKRVAAWLCDEGPRATTATLPRRLVADLLGMRPETFSRALTRLSKVGAVVTTRTTVRIVDQDLLVRMAGRDLSNDGGEAANGAATAPGS